MFSLHDTDLSLLPGSSRLIVQACQRRDWTVKGFIIGSSRMAIDRGDGKMIHIQGSIPPSLGYIAGQIANNKFLSSAILSSEGVRQLDVCLLESHDFADILRDFLQRNQEIVVKPVDGAHGNGVIVGITDFDAACKAIEVSAQFSKSGRVIIQQMFQSSDAIDLRMLCIDGRFIAAVRRLPAHVKGDGINTVQQLITIENKTIRGEAYKSRLARIDLDMVELFLGAKIHDIPGEDVDVTVLGIANYGAGGELIDVTDEVPSWLIQESQKVAALMQLPVAGIDYLLSAESVAVATREQSIIIEVNKGPSLAIHDEPTVGMNRHATEAYLDLIARL